MIPMFSFTTLIYMMPLNTKFHVTRSIKEFLVSIKSYKKIKVFKASGIYVIKNDLNIISERVMLNFDDNFLSYSFFLHYYIKHNDN